MNFLLGETKEVRIEVVSTRNDSFTIQSATFTLTRVGSVQPEAQGAATIDNADIYTLITPRSTGRYYLYFTYQIANETLKALVDLEVS